MIKPARKMLLEGAQSDDSGFVEGVCVYFNCKDLAVGGLHLELLNVAMADAVISCWEAKYHYVFWRPVTAIVLANTDPNPNTDADPTWLPRLTTPAHPEYPSGHATVSGAAATVLAHYFGDDALFSLESETLPGVTRFYTDFSSAADEANNSRVYGGIHFRSACRDGRVGGNSIGSFVSANVAQSLHGKP